MSAFWNGFQKGYIRLIGCIIAVPVVLYFDLWSH